MAKNKGTLLGQLTRGLSIGILAVIVVFLVVLYNVQMHVLVNNATAAMLEQCRILRIVLQGCQDDEERQAALDDFYDKLVAGGKEVPVAFFTYPGHALTPHEMNLTPPVPLEFIARAFDNVGTEGSTSKLAGPPAVMAVTMSTYDRHGRRQGLIYYAQSMDPLEGLAVRLLLVEAGMMLLLWALAVVITYLIVRIKVAAPLLHLYVRQHQASRGQCRPLEVQDKLGTEIAQLYEGYNEMVARLMKYRASEEEAREVSEAAESTAGTAQPPPA